MLYFTAFGARSHSDSLVVSLSKAPISAPERDSAIARMNRQVPDGFDISSLVSQIPETKPALRMLNRDDEGTLWLLSREADGDVLHSFDERVRRARRHVIVGGSVDSWMFVTRSGRV